MKTLISLAGHRTLITGGSRGIGRAAAILFAEAGSDVAFNYCRDEKAALEVKEAVESRGRLCLARKANLARRDEAVALAGAVADAWGWIDILVNNHGIWTYLEMGEGDVDSWKKTIEVNLDGVYYLTDAVVPMMKARNQGCIINVGSTAGIRGEAHHSHYAATKGALNALTKSWSSELAPFGIRVNCVAPGWVDTDMSAESFADPAFRESVRQSIPLKRIPPPEDIAGPILFLASDLARHITGAIINVNGGAVLCG
ncbi:MAG: SDR family NAD(P)-dependent oxidoreductase [Candidatus Aminicenantes bacterium]|nr:SDR family NAD(P)-dependent oxidoreductase [Candidatus Aminicenantes bacterium]